MSEYDEKIEEIKELCSWFNEHTDEVMMHNDGIVLAAVYNEPKHITNMVIGDTDLIESIFMTLLEGALKSPTEHKKEGDMQ